MAQIEVPPHHSHGYYRCDISGHYSAVTSLKDWKTLEDQLERLKGRSLIVDRDEAALSYLQRIGYYRLSGYWYPLRAFDEAASITAGKPVRQDLFVPGSRFEDVVRLYVFDKKLRLLALDALERIELAVRVDVAYLLGKFDPLAHENPDCLHGNFTKRPIRSGRDKGRTQHEVWLEKYQSLLQRSKRLAFVEHHYGKYQGRLPIWVAIELWDFGLLSRLLSGLQHEHQLEIARKYGAESGKAFASWFRSLNFLRNVCAHHSRLWNTNVLELSPVPHGWPDMPNERPFLYFCIMQQMLKMICPSSSWGQRFTELLAEFPNLPDGSAGLQDMGISPAWSEWALWSRK